MTALADELEVARAAFADRRFGEARRAFEAAIALDRGHCRAHAGLARCLVEENRLAEAIATARLAIDLGPLEPWGHLALAIALARARQPADVVRAADAAQRADLSGEQRATLAALQADALVELGNAALAFARATAAVAFAPELSLAHSALAAALVAQDRLGEALPVIDRAIELDPESAFLRERREAIAVGIARAEDALGALLASPTRAVDRSSIGALLRLLGREAEAARALRRAGHRGRPAKPRKKPPASVKPKRKPAAKARPSSAKKPKGSAKPKSRVRG